MCKRKKEINSEKKEEREKELYGLKSYSIQKSDYIDLWKFFQERADTLKDKAWTLSAFLLGLAGVLVGYIIDQGLIGFDSPGFSTENAFFALVFSSLGCLLCIFGWFVSYDHGMHIKRNWRRADDIMSLITPLKAIWDGDKNKKSDEKKNENVSSTVEKKAHIIKKIIQEIRKFICGLIEILCSVHIIRRIMLLFLIYLVVFVAIIIIAMKKL